MVQMWVLLSGQEKVLLWADQLDRRTEQTLAFWWAWLGPRWALRKGKARARGWGCQGDKWGLKMVPTWGQLRGQLWAPQWDLS